MDGEELLAIENNIGLIRFQSFPIFLGDFQERKRNLSERLIGYVFILSVREVFLLK